MTTPKHAGSVQCPVFQILVNNQTEVKTRRGGGESEGSQNQLRRIPSNYLNNE